MYSNDHCLMCIPVLSIGGLDGVHGEARDFKSFCGEVRVRNQDDKDGRTFRVTLIIFLLTIHGTNVKFQELSQISNNLHGLN